MEKLKDLQNKIRKLSEIVLEYPSPNSPILPIDGYALTKMSGYSEATLTLAVYKQPSSPEFAREQATFMMYLGEDVCPKILAVDVAGFVMEFLYPAVLHPASIKLQESFLDTHVWNRPLFDAPFAKEIGDEAWRYELGRSIGVMVPDWAVGHPCLIHGDPTLDNTLMTKNMSIRITDPIPPNRLIRPSIRAIDHGKMLQSLLGWEFVLRGIPRIEYDWPNFMWNYESARRAVFWVMVSLKRIALRNNTSQAGKWAERVAGEIQSCDL